MKGNEIKGVETNGASMYFGRFSKLNATEEFGKFIQFENWEKEFRIIFCSGSAPGSCSGLLRSWMLFFLVSFLNL